MTVNSGAVADMMLERGMSRPSVRKLMQTIATLGPAACLLPLVLPGLALGAAAKVACITGVLVLQAFRLALRPGPSLVFAPQPSLRPLHCPCRRRVKDTLAFCCSYAGFQAYVQDVAPQDAGKIISITNSFGILTGVVGNMTTGLSVPCTGHTPCPAVLFEWTPSLRSAPSFLTPAYGHRGHG